MAGIGRKPLALLAYLGMAPGHRAARERLADLLWPDRATAQARNCLKQSVAVLRKRLGPALDGVLLADRDHLALHPAAIDCDARRLLEFHDRGTEAAAIAGLYRGPFLDGFHSGSEVFDDWAAALRARLESVAVQALHDHARTCDPAQGLVLWQHLIGIDPTREASYQLGMDLHAASGERDQALRLFESCKAMLAREYGVAPSPETEQIRRRILEGRAIPAPDTAPGAGTAAAFPVQRPTVLVAAFENLSSDPAQDRYLRGLVDAIVIELSAVQELDVIRPAAGDTPPGDGADFLLTGSLLAEAGTRQILARIVHAASHRQVLGEKFRVPADQQIDLLDDIAQSIALGTRFALLQDRWKMRDLTPPDPLPIRLLLLKSHARYFELTTASLAEAIRLAEAALALDPSSLRAQRMLSLAISAAIIQGAVPRTDVLVQTAIELARNVARAVPEDVFTRCVLAWALGNDGQHENAVEELKFAIRLNPRYATLHSDLAEQLAILGRVDEALAAVDQAIRLNAEDVVSFWRYHAIAVAQFAAGNDRAALENSRRVMRDKPGLLRGAILLAASAAALGLQDEARQALAYVTGPRPDLRLSTVAPGFMPRYLQDQHHARFLDMLRKAGLPD